MKKLAVYIHWPFCLSKCPYCDFNSRPLPKGEEETVWAESYAQEIKTYAALLPERQITSVYFGGGTPSLMMPATVEAVLQSLAAHWQLTDDVEITLEANPTSSDKEKFAAFRRAGINRLSLGVQSFEDNALRFLGRAHNALEARHAIDAAASVFDRWSFDLIYARAGQTLNAWKAELSEALRFNPKHLSLYQLTLEPGTVFYKRSAREQLVADDFLSVDLYDLTQEMLFAAGLPAYEVSNHAVPGQESRHNLTYWRYDDYIGVGPGAHGRFVDSEGGRRATHNHRHPTQWLSTVQGEQRGHVEDVTLSLEEAKEEALLMGLRLAVGIEKKAWEKKFGDSLDSFLPAKQRQVLQDEGLLVRSDEFLAATAEGRKKLNAVLHFLLS